MSYALITGGSSGIGLAYAEELASRGYNIFIVSNEKGDQLNTEYLVWSREKGTIETNQFVKITTADGVIYGDGMISDENFNNWEVKNGRGIFDIEDE